jgi:SpoIID/LytB domain protein
MDARWSGISMAILVSRRRASLALLAMALVFPLVSMAPAVVGPVRAAEPQFTFEGGGWGHAVGLSQYGAYGMALTDGADSETILTHYFTGVSLQELGTDIPAAAPIWVNILSRASSTLLRPATISGDGAAFVVSHNDVRFPAQPGDAISVEVVGTSGDEPRCRFRVADAVSDGDCFADITWNGTSAAPTSRLTIEGFAADPADPTVTCTNSDWNTIPTTFRPCSYDHGVMHVRPADTDRFHLVLELDIDDYVEGISEMPYFWGEPAGGPNGAAALEAQAIASRSYAVSRQLARGNPADRACWCDVVDTSADQRFVGWGHTGIGHQAWIDAVERSAGVVLTHPSVASNTRPITAYYGSSSYGVTESGLDGFARDTAYLQAVDDRWAHDPMVRNPYSAWSRTLTSSQITEALGIADRVTAVAVSACGDAGAALQIRFTDATGTDHFRATRDLRTVLGLRSPQITAIDGLPACGPDEPDAPALVALGVRIDDNATGDSTGNNDGIAQCGETIELFTVVGNTGATSIAGLTATVMTEDPYVSILYNTTSSIGLLGAGAGAENANDWDLTISGDTPAGHSAGIEIDVPLSSGETMRLGYSIDVECDGGVDTAPITVSTFTIDDGIRGDSVGNNDRIAQCGETIELYVALQNLTDADLDDVTVELTSVDADLELIHNSSSTYPRIDAGAAAENENDWDLIVAAHTEDGYLAVLEFAVTTGGTTTPVSVEIPVSCSAAGPHVAFTGEERIDDGPTGDSIGNNDGRAQCGETIELGLEMTNLGTTPLTGIVATFVIQDPALTVLHNVTSEYPDLEPGASAFNGNDWDLAIGPRADDEPVVYRVRIRHDGGSETWSFQLSVSCDDPSPVAATSVTIDDGIFGDSVGNNDRIPQCGELIELYVELENGSGQDLGEFTARLSEEDPHLEVLYNTDSPYGPIAYGASGENRNDWDVRLGDAFPDRYVAIVTIDVLGMSIDVPITLRCRS